MESIKRKSDDISLVEIPKNLESLAQSDLIELIHSLESERNTLKKSLPEQSSKKLKISTTAPAAAATAVISPTAATAAAVVITPAALDAIKKRMGKTAVKNIKRNVHGGSKKPTAEVSEGNISAAVVTALLGHVPPKSDTKRMTKWQLGRPSDIAELLKCDRLIHPVKHDGKGYIFYNKKTAYHWASFDSMEVKYDKKDESLHFKIKTISEHTGRPEYRQDLQLYAKGRLDMLPSS